MKVVIIGAGNVATVLGKIIQKSGHHIVQVVSRNRHSAKTLADIFGCAYADNVSTLYADADIYLFAITDNALHHLDNSPQLHNKVVVHTAGSVSKDVLISVSEKYGVIYPLQSLSKTAEEIPPVPLLIDGSSSETVSFIQAFSKTLSNQVYVVNDEDRLKFHIAAVFVNNFTNHLYVMADDYCRQENIDFQQLFPLIEETTHRLKTHSPRQVQTGPAIRQDLYTLGKHLKMLSANPDLKYIYVKLSESILKFNRIN